MMVVLNRRALEAGCTPQEAAIYALYLGDGMSLQDLTWPGESIAKPNGHLISAVEKIEGIQKVEQPQESKEGVLSHVQRALSFLFPR